MKTKLLILVGILAAALMTGCSDDNGSSTSTSGSSGSSTGTSTSGSGSTTGSGSGSTSGSGSGSTSGSSGSSGTPPPSLGTEIDRMGRPAINTALTDPFDLDASNENALKDQYNADSDPSDWVTNWTSHFAPNLGILDALDGTCGNQAFAAPAFDDGGVPADRYSTAAGVLANDQLWLNANPDPFGDGGVPCSAYLAVEANATNALPNNDCGGRTPTYDVIDTTYTVVAEGLAGLPQVGGTPVTDGVDQSGHTPVSNTAFPFLGDPR